jgi:hypothetical protein
MLADKRAPDGVPPPAPLHPSIDTFVDALWLEDGLARLTLEAYRRDLRLFNDWLVTQGKVLTAVTEPDVTAYMAARHAGSRAWSDRSTCSGVIDTQPLAVAWKSVPAPASRALPAGPIQ